MAEFETRLTRLAHGGGCGCKLSPAVLRELLSGMPTMQAFPDLLVGIETGDDAAVYRINDEQAIVATTDFFMPIVDDARGSEEHTSELQSLMRISYAVFC